MKTTDFSYFIERYLAGEMSEAEKLWFLKEIDGNPDLTREVELRRKTESFLKRQLELNNLRAKMTKIEKNRKAAYTKAGGPKQFHLKHAAVVAVLVIAGAFLILRDSSISNEQVVENYYEVYEPATGVRSQQGFANTDYARALEYYQSEDYTNAALFFSKVLSDDPKYMESTFLGGVSNFEVDNYPEASRSFVKVIDNDNNLYIEDARWYLALCFLKTGESARASEQLTAIKRSESIYSKDARKILRALK